MKLGTDKNSLPNSPINEAEMRIEHVIAETLECW